MKLRATIGLQCCLAVMAAGINARAGEPIRFSKPAVPIAVQAKDDEGFPAMRDKKPDFGAAPLQEPTVVQPMVVRIQPRDKKKDKDAGVHWLLRDPKDFPDAAGRANARDKSDESRDGLAKGRERMTQEERSESQRSDDGLGLNRAERGHALSPITDFHWDGRKDSRSNSWSGTRLGGLEKKDALDPSPFNSVFSRDESSEPGAESGSSFFSDLFAPRPKEKEKLTEAQLEHRAAFERLLNPNGTVPTRGAGSLEPVISMETSKTIAPAAIPAIASPRLDANPMQPMDAFNQRQSQLRAPVADDFFNRKLNNNVAPTVTTPAGAATDPRFQTPLMRQPTMHELPSRRF